MGDAGTTHFGTTPVFLSNLDLTHMIWHHNNTALAVRCETLASQHDVTTRGEKAAPDNGRRVWLLGPHFSSEREANVMTGRLRAAADILRPCMVDQHWHEVDWITVSMALAIEFSTRLDGLHVVGPAMKILFHMVMHHLCGDTMEIEPPETTHSPLDT